MLERLVKPGSSALILVLEVENQRIGAFSLVAEGKGRFSEERIRLFSLLKEPFAIGPGQDATGT